MFENLAEVVEDLQASEYDTTKFDVPWDATVTIDMAVVHEVSVELGKATED